MKPLALLVALLVAIPDGAKPTSPDDATELYAWSDGLGFPDLARCKFVRVATEVPPEEKNQPAKNSNSEHFLVQENAKPFPIFPFSLQNQTTTKTKPPQINHPQPPTHC